MYGPSAPGSATLTFLRRSTLRHRVCIPAVGVNKTGIFSCSIYRSPQPREPLDIEQQRTKDSDQQGIKTGLRKAHHCTASEVRSERSLPIQGLVN
jgi:hypothetical protein